MKQKSRVNPGPGRKMKHCENQLSILQALVSSVKEMACLEFEDIAPALIRANLDTDTLCAISEAFDNA